MLDLENVDLDMHILVTLHAILQMTNKWDGKLWTCWILVLFGCLFSTPSV